MRRIDSIQSFTPNLLEFEIHLDTVPTLHYRMSQLHLDSYQQAVLDSILDKMTVLCAGRSAKYCFERKKTLKYFQSLKDSEGAVDAQAIDDATWAVMVGGSIIGVVPSCRSFVTPWKKPNFGITFRYRVSPPSSPPTSGESPVYVGLREPQKPIGNGYTSLPSQESSLQYATIFAPPTSNVSHIIPRFDSMEHMSSFPASALPSVVFARERRPILDLETACAQWKALVTIKRAAAEAAEKSLEFTFTKEVLHGDDEAPATRSDPSSFKCIDAPPSITSGVDSVNESSKSSATSASTVTGSADQATHSDSSTTSPVVNFEDSASGHESFATTCSYAIGSSVDSSNNPKVLAMTMGSTFTGSVHSSKHIQASMATRDRDSGIDCSTSSPKSTRDSAIERKSLTPNTTDSAIDVQYGAEIKSGRSSLSSCTKTGDVVWPPGEPFSH